MTEIQLPCCNATARLETLDGPIHCDDCGIDLEIGDPEPTIDLARAA